MKKIMKKRQKPPEAEQSGSEQWPIDRQVLSESYEGLLGVTHLMRAALVVDLNQFICEVIESDENLAATTRKFGLTLLHFAVLNEAHGKDLINFLVAEKKLDPKIADSRGETPLLYALKAGRLENAKELLKHFYAHNLLCYAVFELVDIGFAKSVLEYDGSLIEEMQTMQMAYSTVRNTNVAMLDWLINNNVLNRDLITRDCLYSVALNPEIEDGVKLTTYLAEIWRAGEAKNLSVIDDRFKDISPVDHATILNKLAVADELRAHREVFKISEREKFDILYIMVASNDVKGVECVYNRNKEKYHKSKLNPLEIAVSVANEEMIAWLWDRFELPEDCNPLFDLAQNKKYGHKLVPFFLSKNFDLNEIGVDNQTPLTLALQEGNLSTAAEMIKHGPRLDGRDLTAFVCTSLNEEDEALFRLLYSADRSLVKEIYLREANNRNLEWIASLGLLDVFEKTDKNQTLIHLAVLYANNYPDDVFPYLCSLGVDPNARDNCGKTALHYALLADAARLKTAAVLIGLQANIGVNINRENLLHSCAFKNKLKCAKFLLKKRKELIHDVTMVGETALHIAARCADLEFCSFLVEKGIDANATNKFGLTALDCVPLKSVANNLNELKRTFLEGIRQG